MKKMILIGLLCLGATLKADMWNKSLTASANTGGSISENAAYVVGWDATNGVFRQLLVNGDGSIASNGGTVVFGSLTWSAASIVAYTSVSYPAYTVLTGTVTTVNLTNAAGVSGLMDVWVDTNYGANAGIRWKVNFSATGPSDLCSGVGNYAAATATTQVSGPWAAGAHLHMCSQGTGPTGNYVTVGIARNQRQAP